MGDAGPPTPPPVEVRDDRLSNVVDASRAPVREVKVLVTGFGPFKSFLINPSWLITSALPDELHPEKASTTSSSPYKIKIIIHPSPIRVSYSTVSSILPALLAQHDPDFVLHIGMAGGRDCYSLETRAHRDGYRIKDVDENDGFTCGEVAWKREGVPDCLLVAWDEDEVLARWERGVEHGLVDRGFLSAPTTTPTPAGEGVSIPAAAVNPILLPKGFPSPMKSVWGGSAAATRADEHRKRGVVKLSRDAGRFLCEYALFESLSRRWVDANRYKKSVDSSFSEDTLDASKHRDRHLALERLGKVAFLHVPGWTAAEDVTRGAMVAEEAIRALVGSWEDGFRRGHKAKAGVAMGNTAAAATKSKFTDQNSEVDTGRVTTAGGDFGVGIEDLGRVRWRA